MRLIRSFSRALLVFTLAAWSGGALQAQTKATLTWSDYVASGQFGAAGRCGTPDPETHVALYGEVAEAVPSDCSATLTNPAAEYEPTFIYEIPVVVHVITNTNNDGALTDAQVQGQIDILNEDYQALLGTPGQHGTNVQIRFRLATVDPAGNPTTGITRTANNQWYVDSGNYWDTLAWDPDEYMNLYTMDIPGSTLGYVPFLPASAPARVGANDDRVVVDWRSFGRNSAYGPPYDQGRTATHEIGHYLGLWHTHEGGCAEPAPPNCYSSGDRICDTPQQPFYRLGCAVGSAGCSGEEPIRNYMSYSDDTCMQDFTQEQTRRIRCTLPGYRPNLATRIEERCTQPIPEGDPPFAPSSLTAVPIPWRETQVELTWRDNSCTEDRFVIKRMKASEGIWRTAGEVPKDQTRFVDDVEELSPDPVNYFFYKVFADNDWGSSTPSNRAEARLYHEPPGKPTTLRPRGCIDNLNPLLSWQGGGSSTSFYLHFVEIPTNRERDWVVTGKSSPVPWTLTPHWPYMLKVIGQNNIGHGATSDPEYFVPMCNPTEAPLLESPSAGCIPTTTPEIRWSTVPGALGYHLRINRVDANETEVCTGGVWTDAPIVSWQVPASSPNCPLLPLQPGTEYRVKVKAFTGVDGPYSRLRFFIPQCAPSSLGTASPISPSGGTVSTSHPIYSWEPAAQAESYTIKIVTDTNPQVPAGQQTFPATVCDGQVCSARPAIALANGAYRWWVQANKGALSTTGPYAPMTIAQQNVSLSVADVTLAEAGGAARFTVTASPPPLVPVDVQVATVNGTAAAPGDFTAVSQPLRVATGAPSAVVDVAVASDAIYETDETFRLLLSSPLGATIADGDALATITNDEPVPTLQPVGAVVSEPDAGTAKASFRVDLSSPTEVPISVSYASADCTALAGADYAAASGTLTFNAASGTSRTVDLLVYGDVQPEADETFLFTLSNPVNAVLGQGLVPGVIRDDERNWIVPARADFSSPADGKSDLLLRHDTGGNLVAWFMDGLVHAGGAVLDPPQPATAGWKAVAEADFNADGHADLLWANQNSGNLSLWLMNGTVRTAGTAFTGIADLAWQVAASGDFNGDAKPDLLWHNNATGELKAWFMDGATKLGESDLTPNALPDLNWRVAAVGDLDADGKPDLLWRHGVSGALVVWWLDGVVRLGGGYLNPSSLDLNWQPVGIWDVDLDGKNDVVWQNVTSKRFVAWLMNGATRICGSYIEPAGPATPVYTGIGPR